MAVDEHWIHLMYIYTKAKVDMRMDSALTLGTF